MQVELSDHGGFITASSALVMARRPSPSSLF
jgi:hypothetical protein